jgi:FkbM family methyltransferase
MEILVKWIWRIVAAACVVGGGVFTFYEGAWFGRLYERYTFTYAASKPEAIRAALAGIIGREKTYSQFGQDLWVVHGVAPGKRDGYYLDVGSADGVVISNTKLLDDMGWKGICIDPFPRNMGSRTCQLFNQPVFSESGKHVQFRAAGDLGGIVDDLHRHKEMEEVVKAPLVDFVTATLDEILARAHAPNYIDFMSLDVEGAEYDVLSGLSLDRYHFGGLAIEHNYEPAKREAIHKLLAAHGYVLVRSWWVDDEYVNKSIASRYRDYISYCPFLSPQKQSLMFTDCSY